MDCHLRIIGFISRKTALQLMLMPRKTNERVGLASSWRMTAVIAQAWGSFSYYDEPRSRYDAERKDVIFIDPVTKKNTKRHYTKKAKEK